MILNSPDIPSRIVDEYEFWFENGNSITVSIDKELGDSIDFSTHPMAVVISLSAKPGKTDPSQMMDAQDLTVFIGHVLSIQHTTKTFTPPTLAQQDEWKKTILELSKTIQ